MQYVLQVNGDSRHVDVPPGTSLLAVLRESLGLTGARFGCGHGACVVPVDGAPLPACTTKVEDIGTRAILTIAEVSIGADGAPHLERVWCAVDAGHVVHPDGARNQIEGAVQMGASWTLLEELPERDGEVLASAWEDYPIATFRDAPRAIDVVFTGDDTTPSSGLGEPPAVPIAPAIANAVHDACGVRVRRLPIRAALQRPAPR